MQGDNFNQRIQQGSRLVPGVSEASVPAATTEAIYRKMCADLISRGAWPCSWYMLQAVEEHETVHSDDWIAGNDPCFYTFQDTVEALSVPYVDTACETPAQARTAIMGSAGYTAAHTKYIADGTAAWNDPATCHPGCDARTNAAEDAVTAPMVTALDAMAAGKVPPWTR